MLVTHYATVGCREKREIFQGVKESQVFTNVPCFNNPNLLLKPETVLHPIIVNLCLIKRVKFKIVQSDAHHE